jgi:transposase
MVKNLLIYNGYMTARNLHISRRIVNDWVKRFYEHGLDDLKEKPRSGDLVI